MSIVLQQTLIHIGHCTEYMGILYDAFAQMVSVLKDNEHFQNVLYNVKCLAKYCIAYNNELPMSTQASMSICLDIGVFFVVQCPTIQ